MKERKTRDSSGHAVQQLFGEDRISEKSRTKVNEITARHETMIELLVEGIDGIPLTKTEVAQVMVHQGLELEDVVVRRDLEEGLKWALGDRGFRVQKPEDSQVRGIRQ